MARPIIGYFVKAAEKLIHARNITIGEATKSFDGSRNITFTLDDIGAGKGSLITVVNEQVSIASEETRIYNLATILGDTIGDYNLSEMSVTATVRDDNANSPTHNLFVNSEAVLVVGVSADNQEVRIYNARLMTATTKVRIALGAAVSD